jgi:ABC-type glycerol-3-phosphate transport system permease component
MQAEMEAVRARQRVVIRRWLANIGLILTYALIVAVFFSPLAWALGNSFRTSQDIWRNLVPVTWRTFLPSAAEFTVENYLEALGLTTVGRGFGLNMSQALLVSLASSLAVVACSLVFNTCAAYFFARLRFPGKPLIMLLVIATMTIPQQAVIVPLFLVVRDLGLINTFWALVVPWYASPFIVFALTQFFAAVPRELDEAAIIDGANPLQVLWHVVIPNSLPGLISVSLLEFQYVWNEFYWPLVAVSSKELLPVQVAIAMQFSSRDPQWGRIFASTVIASAPVILLFVVLQRYYFESVALSGLKGS